MELDDYSDVNLAGVPLVSDNYRNWRIPRAAANHESFFAWWDNLVESDNRWFAANLDQHKAEKLLWLADLFNELDGVVPHTAVVLSKKRSVIRGMLHTGLTIEQAARLLERTNEFMVRAMYANPSMQHHTIAQYLHAERMIRHGMTDTQVASSVGMAPHQISQFRRLLGLERDNPRALPMEVRERALQMRASGMKPAAISKVFANEGLEVSRLTICKWWSRYGKEAAA